jgi:hypothetical protein
MNTLKDFAALVVTVLREIFDENAYARFLARESREPSAAAYADFMQEKHSAPVRRCC